MERYAGLKSRLFQFQNEEEFRVQPLGDARIDLLLRPMKSRPLWFGFADPTGDGVWLEGNSLRFRFAGKTGTLVRRDEASLRGPHNTEDMAAAAAAPLPVGIPGGASAEAAAEDRAPP